MWSLEDYCASQQAIDLNSLQESSRTFLETLHLPIIHPFCDDNLNGTTLFSMDMEGVPPMGRLEHRFGEESVLEIIVTMWYMVAPPLLAMAELWLRLLAGALGPLGILYLLMDEVKGRRASRNDDNTRTISLVCVLSVASCLVLMTDTLYVLNNGPYFGAVLFVVSVFLAVHACLRYNLSHLSILISLVVLLAAHLLWDYDTDRLTFGDKADEVRIDEGLYFDPSNQYMQSVVDHWPEKYRVYNKANGATPWMPTGDSRTGLPFLVNHLPNPEWHRVFLQTLDDEEYVALDISFPPNGHDPTQPMYLVFHGLNGGSDEMYIRDLTFRRIAEGSTVLVMVARGLMDLPVRGWDMFHGARTVDAHAAALAVRRALGPDQVVVGVGYSMGAIVLNNYVASYGPDCALDGAIGISGGLDMRYQEHFYRAQRLWQPMLAETLRDEFLLGKWGERVLARLSEHEMLRTMRASHVTEIDKYAVVAYNHFRDLEHYYTEMSALGDIPHGRDGLLEENNNGKIHGVSIPFCVLQAFDDPLLSWRATTNNEGVMHPENLVRTGSGHTMLLLTKAGGHVGWPLGILPFVDKWKWMSDAAMGFARAVDEAKRLHKAASEESAFISTPDGNDDS